MSGEWKRNSRENARALHGKTDAAMSELKTSEETARIAAQSAQARFDETLAEKDAEIAAKDAEIAKLKAALKPVLDHDTRNYGHARVQPSIVVAVRECQRIMMEGIYAVSTYTPEMGWVREFDGGYKDARRERNRLVRIYGRANVAMKRMEKKEARGEQL